MSKGMVEFREIASNTIEAVFGEKEIPVGIIMYRDDGGCSWQFGLEEWRSAATMDEARAAILRRTLRWYFFASPQASLAQVLEHADSTRRQCRE